MHQSCLLALLAVGGKLAQLWNRSLADVRVYVRLHFGILTGGMLLWQLNLQFASRRRLINSVKCPDPQV